MSNFPGNNVIQYLVGIATLIGLVLAVSVFFQDGTSPNPVIAQNLTDTPSPSPTPSATPTPTRTPQPTTPIDLTIFRDNDSVTLLIPAAATISLEDIALQVTNTQGSTITLSLTDFPSLLPLGNLTTPVCLRLVRGGASGVAPLGCQRLSSEQVRIQPLAASDIFWRDDVGGSDRTIIVLQDGASVGICPAGQTTCDVMLSVPHVTVETQIPTTTETLLTSEVATPIDTLTLGTTHVSSILLSLPCEATLFSRSGASTLNIFHAYPSENAPLVNPQRSDIAVILQTRYQDPQGVRWFRIMSLDGQDVGWIVATSENILLSEICLQP